MQAECLKRFQSLLELAMINSSDRTSTAATQLQMQTETTALVTSQFSRAAPLPSILTVYRSAPSRKFRLLSDNCRNCGYEVRSTPLVIARQSRAPTRLPMPWRRRCECSPACSETSKLNRSKDRRRRQDRVHRPRMLFPLLQRFLWALQRLLRLWMTRPVLLFRTLGVSQWSLQVLCNEIKATHNRVPSHPRALRQ